MACLHWQNRQKVISKTAMKVRNYLHYLQDSSLMQKTKPLSKKCCISQYPALETQDLAGFSARPWTGECEHLLWVVVGVQVTYHPAHSAALLIHVCLSI